MKTKAGCNQLKEIGVALKQLLAMGAFFCQRYQEYWQHLNKVCKLDSNNVSELIF